MRKFVIRLAEGSDQRFMRPVHDTRNEAIQCIVDYVAKCNVGLSMNDPRRMSPFDFKVEEVEVDDEIADFKDAVKYLCLNGNDEHSVCGRDVAKLLRELNPRHVEALIALNELFTIAKAWNNVDGFVPDFSDNNQQRYVPWFTYSKIVDAFVCNNAVALLEYAGFGYRFCFKTVERAKQFGQRFAGLFNKFLMLDREEEVGDGR